MIIKNISATETYPIRHSVLRKGKPIESCRFENDELQNTVHLGLFIESKLVGVATLLENKHPDLNGSQCQLRGMAVLEQYRNKGLGELLLTAAENQVLQNNAELLWFNARERAVSFYSKCGYKILGDAFEVPGVGQHFVMYKVIKNRK